MTAEQTKSIIKESLSKFGQGNLTETSLRFFENLGYTSDKQAPLDSPTFEEFQDNYIIDKSFDEVKAKVNDWKYIDLLFQLTKEEVSKQATLFDTKKVNQTIIEAYLFFVIELSNEAYTRTELATITRQINRLFPMPAMILFKHGKTLTLSVINRRLHKRDSTKDVLEKVTLIKDINIEDPHRAHIEILYDLTFDELKSKHQFTNFVELHNAWQKTLDTKELNKRFYRELFNWYLWAVRSVTFPNDVNDDKDDMVYNSESVIRLLTRLIFVWFIKEKNLVPNSLFEQKKLNDILKEFQPYSMESSVYYRAILQNLFFATLNTPMDKDITEENKDEKRRFINTLPKTSNDHYLDQTKYRYQNYFTQPDKTLELFSTIPFLNGGLFECLDFIELNKKTGRPKEMRYDGFSSTKKRQAFVPDKLFFADEFMLDLNAEYGTKGKRYKVEGLINILDSYKFTITENTPLEEEIALDPELLGKVFENLLASYNPETQTTARKQTGSFYTPREIVNYMVDESLIAYFKQKLDSSDETESKLRDLFSHAIDLPEFTEKETDQFIKAISEAKILDPACGSGAFPMGVLHRLVDLLNKLDPENKQWNELQIQRAIDETEGVYRKGNNSEERKLRLNEIERAFDLSMNYPNYARKLFLIENCIYGVDIQQIAIQISKLRFFIALIVDQKVNDAKPNRNILSMPNLETKFVAANTLIGLDKPQQMTLMAGDVERLEKELASIRHKIFFTRKYSAKKALKKSEKSKREELQKALENSGYTKNIAGQMAGWNPFDPMQSAKFFDPLTMFGFRDGFDIVTGNPPYVEAKKLKEISQTLKKIYTTYSGTADLYVYFYENGIRNLKPKGTLVFITSNKFIKTSYGENLRRYFTDFKINEIIDFTDVHVFEALVASCIFSITKKKDKSNDILIAFANDSLTNFSGLWNFIKQNKFSLPQKTLSGNIWQLEKKSKLVLKSKIEKDSVTILKTGTINVYRGVTTGYNPAFIINEEKRLELIQMDSENKKIIKPMLQGRNIRKWVYNSNNEFLLQTGYDTAIKKDYPEIFEHLNQYKKKLEVRSDQGVNWWNLRACKYYPEFEKEKIIWGLTSDKWTFAYDNEENYLPSNGYILTSKEIPIKFILALMNSKLMEFYFGFIGIMTAGGAFTLKYQTVVEFPIKKVDPKIQNILIELVDFILYFKEQNKDSILFERIIDSIVYELYLPDEIKAGGADVLKFLNELPELSKDDEAKNLKIIEGVYKELSDPKHPISAALLKLLTIDEVNIIEGRK